MFRHTFLTRIDCLVFGFQLDWRSACNVFRRQNCQDLAGIQTRKQGKHRRRIKRSDMEMHLYSQWIPQQVRKREFVKF